MKSHGPAAMNPSASTPSRGIRKKRVAGELFLHEARVGLVLVERPDDVIAIRPRVRPWLVLVVTVRLAVVNDIEPVPRPALAVMRRSQQPVHERFECGFRIAFRGPRKFLDLLELGRQPDQVEIKPAAQRARIGRRGPVESVCRQLRINERVDRVRELVRRYSLFQAPPAVPSARATTTAPPLSRTAQERTPAHMPSTNAFGAQYFESERKSPFERDVIPEDADSAFGAGSAAR